MANHLSAAYETTWGTWVQPVVSIPVETAGINPASPLMENVDTSGGRGMRQPSLGELSVNGPIDMKLYPVTVPWIFRSFMGTIAVAALTSGKRNKMLPNDDAAFKSLSLQKHYSSSVYESISGAKLNTCNITARSREFAMAQTTWIAKDVAVDGGNWIGAGTTGPTLFTPAYNSNLAGVEPFKFSTGVLRIGGSLALTAGEIVVTGGTDRCEVDNVAININQNLSADAYGICLDDATVQQIDEGNRRIGVTFEPNFSTVNTEFWEAWLGGTSAIVELYFQGPEYATGENFEIKVTLPQVHYDGAPNPAIDSAYGLKRVSVSGQAAVEATTTNTDIGIVVQSQEDLSAAQMS